MGPPGGDAVEQGLAGHAWHTQVHHHEVHGVPPQDLAGGLAGGRQVDGVPPPLEGTLERPADGGLVIHYQDGELLGHDAFTKRSCRRLKYRSRMIASASSGLSERRISPGVRPSTSRTFWVNDRVWA